MASCDSYISVDDRLQRLRRDHLIRLRELAGAGKPKPVIDRRYLLEEIAEAHRYVEQGPKQGNVVITIAIDLWSRSVRRTKAFDYPVPARPPSH